MFRGCKNILFLDAETYYAQNYTLRAMTIPEYLLDPKFELIIMAAAVNGEASQIIDGPDFGEWLYKFDPNETCTITFNALFDNSILAWHYGWVPRMMLDSMNMARALRGHILPRLNLETVCKVLGTPHQKGGFIKNVINLRRADIIAKGMWQDFCAYANDDNEGSRDIFKMLIGEFPHSERRLMDLVIRAAVQPRFLLDKANLQQHLANVQNSKDKLLVACGADQNVLNAARARGDSKLIKSEVTRIGLMSTAGFKAALEKVGVQIEYKNNTAGLLIPAFAKGDQFMTDLQEHFDPRVQALACARLGVKSTIEETRTERLISIASLAWDAHHVQGQMPVPLRYSGAHTHRLSGDWRLNMQNMPRGSSTKPPMLRRSLIAPPGHVVVAGDLAQIEARMVAWLAGCIPLLAEFAKKGGDPYSAFASLIFGMPINRKTVIVRPDGTKFKPHEIHGFIGKTGVLGLGYQCGESKFFAMVELLARLQGIDLASICPWTPAMASKVVHTYRGRYNTIPMLWNRLQHATQNVWFRPGTGFMNVGPVTIRHAEIEGPNGLSMKYHRPRFEDGEYQYTYGWGTYKMYGGKMLENIVQFLSRIIIMNAALRLADCGYNFVLQAHDELVYIVPLAEEQSFKALLYRELTRPPSWGRDIPLEAEVKSGPSYGDAK